MADLGKVSITDAGNYAASTTYEKLTFVHYNGNTYMTLKTVKGVVPNDDGVNYRLFAKSAILATATAAGLVKPASTDFTLDSNGTQKINLGFSEATKVENISSKDSWLTILGKIAKSISTVMSVNTNALLKSALSNVDVNDSNKIPTSALFHSIWDRIGMGNALGIGSNLTDAVNSLNSNLTIRSCGIAPKNNATITSGYAKRKGNVCVVGLYGITCNPYTIIGTITEADVKTDIWIDIDDDVELRGRDIFVKNVTSIGSKTLVCIDE